MQISYVFVQFKSFVETQTNYKLKSIQIDNVKDFLNLASFLCIHGIRYRLTCLLTHE